MKNLKPLLGLLLLFVIGSCSNNEFGYNEKATSLFLDEMRQIDDTQKDFADTAHMFQTDFGDSIKYNTKADNTITNAQRDIQNMNDLKPSDAAKEFNQGIITYFTKIKNYGSTAKQLLAAAPPQKKILYAQLTDQYKDLNQMPDQLLATQKQYLNKVGLKAQQ